VPCSICQHGERQAIEAAVSRGDSYRTIEAVYQVNKSSLSRHTRQCLTGVSAAPQAVTMAPMGQGNFSLPLGINCNDPPSLTW
jgi:hypothetical protein